MWRKLWKMRTFFIAACVVSVVLVGHKVFAHSGGLNASGCHGGSRPYHCHRTPSEMVVTAGGRNRLRCDLGSRSRECIGTGSARTETRVLNMQIQLKRHCSGLPGNFSDGRNGPATRAALRTFQEAYGLTPDGIYGRNTAKALASSPNGRCRIKR